MSEIEEARVEAVKEMLSAVSNAVAECVKRHGQHDPGIHNIIGATLDLYIRNVDIKVFPGFRKKIVSSLSREIP